MSLARAALRLCAVRALRGQTLVGQAVRDSEQGPIDEGKATPEPGIYVYTDDGKLGAAGTRDLFAAGEITLSIETLVTSRQVVKHRNGDEVVYEQPATDAGIEFSLDVIERQIKVALSDPLNDWAALAKEFTHGYDQALTKRGASMREGVRFAGRSIEITAKLIRDPAPGTAPGLIWQKFLSRVDNTADLAPLAGLWHELLDGGPSWPLWRAVAASYGLTLAEAEAMLIAPPAAAQEASPTFADELGQVTELGP